MKKYRVISLIMILLLMIPTLSGCGGKAKAGEEAIVSAEMIGSDGTPVTCHAAFRSGKRGSEFTDGDLKSMSIYEYLSDFADDIPSVELGSAPEFRVAVGEEVEIDGETVDVYEIMGRETVDVYSEDYRLLAEYVPLEELTARGESEWAGQTVYLFFNVRFYWSNGDYDMIGYFVRTTF
ncbi:MAG: hypothetical protein E7554_02425 [Ruminococcaceae bacterium]|nr:hypothetical protein [Oscillospiraceae bacterium]